MICKKYNCPKTLTAILLCALLAAGCTAYKGKQSIDMEKKKIRQALLGTWVWQSSSGGFSGRQRITPETAGYTKVIDFSEDGVFKEFHSDELFISTGYTIEKKKTIFGSRNYVISFADSMERISDKVIMEVNEKTLFLSDPCPDCFSHFYVRMEE